MFRRHFSSSISAQKIFFQQQQPQICSVAFLNNNVFFKSSKSTTTTSKKNLSSNKNKNSKFSKEETEENIQDNEAIPFALQQRQALFDDETRAFDLRVKQHEQELAAFRQQQLESNFELIDEDEKQLSDSVMRALIKKQQAAKKKETKSSREGDDEDDEVEGDSSLFIPSPAPDLLMVQICDHMQHDQGVKRHALTITFGSDGFRLQNMCKEVRRDLRKQLATSYWQMHQTQERSAFFVCTRISHGTADLLITSMTQRVVGYVEKFGYRLNSSYVTLSPDVQHTSVRMLYHYFVFRRTDESKLLELQMREEIRMEKMEELQKELGEDDLLEEAEAEEETAGKNDEDEVENDMKKSGSLKGDQEEDAEDDDGDVDHVRGQPEFKNFEAPKVGPQEPSSPPKKVSKDQKVGKIWKD